MVLASQRSKSFFVLRRIFSGAVGSCSVLISSVATDAARSPSSYLLVFVGV